MLSRQLVSIALFAPAVAAQFTGFWENRPKLAIPRQEVGAAALGGKLYVAGGLLVNRGSTPTVEVYDPSTGKWGRVTDMPLSLHHHGLCAIGGKLYQVGGYTGAGFTPTRSCHSWDPATNKWTPIADLPRARGAFVAVAIGGKIYAAGGIEQTIVSKTLVIYDPATDKWSSGAPMQTAREHFAAAAVDGLLYVAGGRAQFSNINLAERYDPSTNRWTQLPPMPTARGGNGAAALDGRLVVVGGEQFRPDKVFVETEQFDPNTNRWLRLRDMSIPVHGIYPVNMGDEIVIPGGGLIAGYSVTAAVTALRRLPTGTERYGRSTPACNGDIAISVTEAMRASASSFAYVTSPNAPPNTGGVLALAATQDPTGRLLLGFRLHVGLTPAPVLVPTTTDARGAARVPLSIPAGHKGAQLFSQFLFPNPASCTGRGPISASDALDTTVQ